MLHWGIYLVEFFWQLYAAFARDMQRPDLMWLIFAIFAFVTAVLIFLYDRLVIKRKSSLNYIELNIYIYLTTKTPYREGPHQRFILQGGPSHNVFFVVLIIYILDVRAVREPPLHKYIYIVIPEFATS